MGKHSYKQMKKRDRESRKLWAEGCQEGILAPHVKPYADALVLSCVTERDYIRRVQNEYHQLIPWELPDDKELPLPLPEYDPKVIMMAEELTAEESEHKSKVVTRKNKVIALTVHTLSNNF